ncbi:ricin-type beta-trefoil lectin domain protein [Streptomyces sp. NPDC020412]|uniref:ricin-type beta-trefoil lectin domain protein n=1 Tax=Streptomyces sp. NPDC020412 TaxID=3365073 RepID=UPI003796C291
MSGAGKGGGDAGVREQPAADTGNGSREAESRPVGQSTPKPSTVNAAPEVPRPPKLDDGKIKGPVLGFAAKRCLDIVGGKAVDGAQLRLDACSGQQRQRFEFRPDGQVWTLYQQKMCMDVAWGSKKNGAAIQIANCAKNGAQKFQIMTDGSLVNPQSGKCVEAVDLGGSTGFRLQLQTCDGAKNQKWQIG